MKRGEALPGNYLGKEDFPHPIRCVVDRVSLERVKGEHGEEDKPVLYLAQPSHLLDTGKGVILNHTNWSLLEEIGGSDDSDDWVGKQIVVYTDPNVMFGAKRVGGLRIRAPKVAAAEPPPAPPPPADDDLSDEEIPF